MIPRQRPLLSKKEFLALPEELQLRLSNDLLALLYRDLSPVEQRKAATDTNPPPIENNASEAF